MASFAEFSFQAEGVIYVCGEATYSFDPAKCPAERYINTLAEVGMNVMVRHNVVAWSNRQFYGDYEEEILSNLLQSDVGCSRWR